MTSHSINIIIIISSSSSSSSSSVSVQGVQLSTRVVI